MKITNSDGEVIYNSNRVGKKRIIVNTISLTKEEQDLLWFIVKSQIDWREGGCLNDGEEVDEKKMKLAESILKMI